MGGGDRGVWRGGHGAASERPTGGTAAAGARPHHRLLAQPGATLPLPLTLPHPYPYRYPYPYPYPYPSLPLPLPLPLPHTPSLNPDQAQCQLQLQAWAKAEELCDRVLQREPNHAKALYRRGTALMQLGEPTRARADLRVAYRAAPTDRGVRQLLDECERTVREEARQERAYTSRMFAAPPQMAIAEPAGGGARGNAGGAVGVGWASESRAAAWWRAARHALMAPWGLVGCLSSYPGLTHAIALLGVVVVAPLVLSAVVLAALSYFV